MSEDAIQVIPQLGDAAVSLLSAAIERRDSLTAESAGLIAVKNKLDADYGIGLLADLRGFRKEVDEQHTRAKAPVLEIGRKIDGLKKELLTKVEQEEQRLSRLLGSYEAEQRRIAAEQQRKAEDEKRRIAEETRKKIEDAAKTAPTEEAAARATDAALEQGAAKVAEIVAATPTRTIPKGVRLRPEIKFEVNNIDALFLEHPNLVKLVPNDAAIKAIIKANPNIQLAGVRHWIEEKI
jgi:flagellar biosynthesis GTPase FlhF